MNIKIQVNHSDKRSITKTLTTHAEWEGTLKPGTDIINPVFVMQSNDLISLSNYLTVVEFKRSYFINDIVAVNNNIVEVHCHVDVLSSFRDEILDNEAVIYRQENLWNLMLDDGSFKFQNNPEYITKPFPVGFELSEYVLTVAGGA